MRVMVFLVAVAGIIWIGAGQAQDSSPWVMPRTPEGYPDLEGNWTNATITPIERSQEYGAILTPEQVLDIEGRRQEFINVSSAPSDPDREAPPAGGVSTGGDAVLDAAAGGTGGYNIFYLDRGDRVAIYNGELRSSLVTRPENGRVPQLTPEGEQRRRALFLRRAQFGEYDNPENRPVAERCILSFGSNAGPPMLPNYFYNNNYTIVQTSGHIMIMTEMVHDVRIIQLGEPKAMPNDIRPWLGESWGRWVGDTLIVETTNLNLEQLNAYRWFLGASENLKVTERFTRASDHTINYSFTVEDPDTYTSLWGGELPFQAMEGDLLYEYACHEGNYALSNVLSGARAEERQTTNDR